MNNAFKRAIAASIPAILLAGTALPAAADTKVYAGGATFPVPAYLGNTQSSGSFSTGSAGSVFGYFASQSGGLNVQYCSTGSGNGKAIYEGASGTDTINCANASSSSTATTFGFSAPASQAFPPLVGSDAPLTQTDVNNYDATHKTSGVYPVELPAVYGSIAIYYNYPNFAAYHSAHPTFGRLMLTDQQLCQIFSGRQASGTPGLTWGELLGITDSHPVTAVYRSDGSGTSFNFSNHLANAASTLCTKFYGANQYFADLASNKTPGGAVIINPHNVPEHGNSGVLGGVQATPYSVGYVEAGYLLKSTLTSTLNYADMKNPAGNYADPFVNLPAAAISVNSANLLSAVAVNQTNAGGGPATVSGLTGVPTGSAQGTGCVKVVNPASVAQLKSTNTSGYPILGVTYLLFNGENNGVNATPLHLLVTDLTTLSNFKGQSNHITTVDAAGSATGSTGYSSLDNTFTSLQGTASSCIVSGT